MRTEANPPRGQDDWIERVRAATDIVELVGESVSLKRVGRNWMGLCPFHSERTPSFSVHGERQFYHCFSCKAGGDVFRYVQETERIGFVEAAELLSRRAGIPVPERGGQARGSRGPLREALEAAAVAYEQWLADPGTGGQARGYLEGRGIDDETRRAFRVGVAPAGWDVLARRLRGRHPDEVLVLAGLAVRRPDGSLYDRFRNRLMVPLIAAGGDVVGFGARALQAGDEPKYLNSPETPLYHKGSFVFGLDQARRHVPRDGELVIVEGYFDVMGLHQAGVRNVLAVSGTALTADHARALRRVAPRVALTFDADAAGKDAASRALGVLLAEGLEVAVVELPAGEDPDSLIRKGGREAWETARAAARDPIAFVQRHGLQGAGDPRERALQAVVQLVARVPDPIRRGLLLERAAAVFGMSERVLARAVELRLGGQVSEQPVRAAVRVERGIASLAERALLRALLQSPEALAEARASLVPDDFEDPVAAAVAQWLWDESEAEAEPEDAGAAAAVRELAATAPEHYDWREEARGGVRNLVLRRHKRRRRACMEALQSATGEDEQLRLLADLKALNETIDRIQQERFGPRALTPEG